LDQKLKKEKQYFTFESKFQLFNASSTLGFKKPPSFGSLIKANQIMYAYIMNKTKLIEKQGNVATLVLKLKQKHERI
jgi:hypothetical protein